MADGEVAEINMSTTTFYLIIAALLLWVLPWKGVALWKAARNRQLVWFIAMLVLNTLAILEIIYIFYFSKPKEQ